MPYVAWTPRDDAVLRELYPIYGSSWEGWREILPGHAARGIKNRALTLGLRVPKRSAWDETQRTELIKAFRSLLQSTGHNLDDCVKELRRLVGISRKERQ